ncbi:MAG: D-aminoacylase [Planctomycetota bacterium]
MLAAKHCCLALLATFGDSARTQDSTAATPVAFDLVLRGGVLVDGPARTTRPGNLAIAGGRIAAVGDFSVPPGTPVLELGGLFVAPGFIDVHTHVDTEIVREPLCQNFLRMGVTTLITGNCGSSVKDIAAHFDRLEKGGIGVNYGSLVGLGTVRTAVLGTKNRAPDLTELQRMADLVEAGMQAGAFGVSTGLIYVPGIYAARQELEALAAVAGHHGGLYASHMRYEGDEVLDAIEEALAIGAAAKTPVHISHIKCTGKPNHGRSEQVLARLRQARADGARVTADQYAYDASSTSLDVLFPADALEVGRDAFAARLRNDAEFRATMREALLRRMDQVGFGDFRYARIASAKGNADLNGMLLPEAAEKRLQRNDREAQADIAIELFTAAAPTRVGMVYHTMAEADVERFMREDWIAVASDAGIRSEASADRPHPRGSGNNPRVLAHYVRERGVTDLPTAVFKMTALPARIFGLEGRGELRPGFAADLVVFDPEAILDRATFTEPVRHPDGIVTVFVNGQIAVQKDQLTGVRAGAVLRHSPRKGG